MTLRLTRQQRRDIVAHVLEDESLEAVGVLVRHVSSHEGRVVRLANSAEDPAARFEVSEKDVARLYRQLKASLEYIDVIYHSHTHSPAIPSQRDLDHADLEDAHYLIVSTGNAGITLRSWRIQGDTASEERVELVG